MEQIKIIAHSGSFHADDIFAVATLQLLLGDSSNISVTRTRDVSVIETGDYVVDVGGVYDESENRFDHHQMGGAGKRDNGIPYASFGLVWKKFGLQLCGSTEVVEKIDEILVQWIDATDNGIQIIETKVPGIYPYDIGLFFNSFTPGWKEEEVNIDDVFIEVVGIAKMVLNREISKRKDLVEAIAIVERIYLESPDKRLIVLDKFYPSREILSKFPEPLFVVFPRDDGGWTIKTIKNDNHTFIDRKSLPESWAGKNGRDLEKVTGVEGAVFCHNGRFIAVSKTKEAILKMAEIALNQ